MISSSSAALLALIHLSFDFSPSPGNFRRRTKGYMLKVFRFTIYLSTRGPKGRISTYHVHLADSCNRPVNMSRPQEITKSVVWTINQNNFKASAHAENFAVNWIIFLKLEATWEAKSWKDRLKFHFNLKSTIFSTEELFTAFAWRN